MFVGSSFFTCIFSVSTQTRDPKTLQKCCKISACNENLSWGLRIRKEPTRYQRGAKVIFPPFFFKIIGPPKKDPIGRSHKFHTVRKTWKIWSKPSKDDANIYPSHLKGMDLFQSAASFPSQRKFRKKKSSTWIPDVPSKLPFSSGNPKLWILSGSINCRKQGKSIPRCVSPGSNTQSSRILK